MNRYIEKSISFFKISGKRKILFTQIIFLSILSSVFKLFGSPKAYTEYLLSDLKEGPSDQLSTERWKKAKDIAFAIELGRKYIPWRNLCRHQAWQAVVLLKRAGIPFSYHVGVKKNSNQKSEGHAWVMVDGKFISGKCLLIDYQEIRLKIK